MPCFIGPILATVVFSKMTNSWKGITDPTFKEAGWSITHQIYITF